MSFFPAAGSINLSRNKDANKLESIKNWTISTYKCSRQVGREALSRIFFFGIYNFFNILFRLYLKNLGKPQEQWIPN